MPVILMIVNIRLTLIACNVCAHLNNAERFADKNEATRVAQGVNEHFSFAHLLEFIYGDQIYRSYEEQIKT